MSEKIIKHNDGFSSIEKAREWVIEFVNWYNNDHRHSGLKFLTPNQRHTGQAEEIIKKRKKVKPKINNVLGLFYIFKFIYTLNLNNITSPSSTT